MKVTEAIDEIDKFEGQIVVIDGYIGHKCDGAKINQGIYEETWIAAASNGDKNLLRIELLPSPGYPRPYRFYETVHTSRVGGILTEYTEEELVRFCGRLTRNNSRGFAASLSNLQWCEFPKFQKHYYVGEDGTRSRGADYEFKWRFTISDDAQKPDNGVVLAEFLRDCSKVPHELVRVSGVAVIESNIPPNDRGNHVFIPTLADELTPSLRARIEIRPIPRTLNSILMDVDLEDRLPDFRVFQCIVEGSYEPEKGPNWVGRFFNLRELIVVKQAQFRRLPGDLSKEICGYIFFPKSLLT